MVVSSRAAVTGKDDACRFSRAFSLTEKAVAGKKGVPFLVIEREREQLDGNPSVSFSLTNHNINFELL